MDTAATLRVLLLLGANIMAGPFVYWLHLRADARRNSPMYHRVSLLFCGGILFGVSFIDMLHTGASILNQLVSSDMPVTEMVVCVGFGVAFCFRQLSFAIVDWRERRARRPSITESAMLSSCSETLSYGATESTNGGPLQRDQPLPAVALWASLSALGSLCAFYVIRYLVLGHVPAHLQSFEAVTVSTVITTFALTVVLYSSSEPMPMALLAGSFVFATLPGVAYATGTASNWSVSRMCVGATDTFCCGVLLCASALGLMCPYSSSVIGCCSFPPVTAGIVFIVLLRIVFPAV